MPAKKKGELSQKNTKNKGIAEKSKEDQGKKEKKEKEKVHKKKPHFKVKRDFQIYIFRVMKQIDAKFTISKKSMTIVDCFVRDMFERIAKEASLLCKYSKKLTLTSREIAHAIKLILPGELATHAQNEGNKAIAKYMQAVNQNHL
jgi:histone H2B